MRPCIQAIARTGHSTGHLTSGRAAAQGETSFDAGRLPLAGSGFVWFDQVHLSGGPEGTAGVVPAADLLAEDRKRLCASRPALCGLSLDQPRVMGILNVTPDSFSDGGDFHHLSAAVARAQAMAKDADILDIGGESTRPGAQTVPDDEEIRRTAPVIRAIREAGVTTPISIDTRKASVARAALEAGADMVNDVTALRFDPDMARVVADFDVPVCLMHSIGTPETMQSQANYQNVLYDIYDHLRAQIEGAMAAGIRRDRLILDPGIGFGKTLAHNLTLLRGLSLYHDLGAPILLGASRKRFIGTIGAAEEAKDRMGGSLAVALHGAAQGVHILRVHDTYETRQALRLQLAIEQDD